MSRRRNDSSLPQEKNLRNIFIGYYEYWHVFLICIILCIFFASIYIRYYSPSEYLITSTLLIKDSDTNIFTPTMPGNFGSQSQNKKLGNEMVILRSSNLMRRVLDELGLRTSYYIEGRFSEIEVYEGYLPISVIVNNVDPSAYGMKLKISPLPNNTFKLIEYDEVNEPRQNIYKFGQQISKPYAKFTVLGASDQTFLNDINIRFNNIEDFTKHYSKNLIISLESENSNVLRLGLKDNIPQRSINILNKLVEVYNKEAIEDKTQVELNTIDFLDERIQFLSTELSDVEKDVEIYKKDNLLINVESNAQMYMQTASEYNKELVSIELQLEIFQSIEDYVSKEELSLIPNSLNLSDPIIISLIGRFNEMQLERLRLLRTIQPGSAMIQNLEDQIANLKSNIKENLRNIKNELILTRNNLKNSSAQYQTKVRSVPSIERELLEINRQQGIKQQIYLFLLQKREEAGLTLASTSPNSRIIDPATSTDYPINNNKSVIYILALGLGIFLPIGYIYAKDLIDDKISDRKEVEKLIDIPILGEIAHFENKDPLQIIAGRNTIIAEHFRLIRANLQFCNLRKENKVILVTSCKSGEGKTSFSINLGASIALTGKKVVILGFDLRKPRLMENLKLHHRIGIVDYLVTPEINLDSIITPVPEVTGLYVIGSGSNTFNPGELMMSSRVELLINELRNKFDKIIIDTSPIGQVADTFYLGPLSDSSILVVRYNYTTKSQMEYLGNLYFEKKLNQPLLVLNDAKKKVGDIYGYGYGNNEPNGHKKIQVDLPETKLNNLI